MKNRIIKFGLPLLFLALLLVPLISFAQTTPPANACSTAYANAGGLEGMVDYLRCILARSVIPLLFALAFVVFIWGVLQFIMNSGDENKRTQGKQFMVWGLVGLFVMFSVWGLVLLLGKTFKTVGTEKLFIPALPGQE